jgi:hypothetical protein
MAGQVWLWRFEGLTRCMHCGKFKSGDDLFGICWDTALILYLHAILDSGKCVGG